MRYLPLIWAGLIRRPVRSLLTFLSIFVAFILFALLGGISAGLAHVREASRLDMLYTTPRFGAPLPYAYAGKIAAVPGVTIAAPETMMRGYYRDPKNPIGVQMVRPDIFAAHDDILVTKAQIAAFAANRSAAIVGVGFARAYGWKVGDKVSITSATLSANGGRSWTFDIIAIAQDADYEDLPFFVANYDYFDQARLTDKGTINMVSVRTNDPTRSAEISRAIDALFANSPAPTRTISEKANQQSSTQALGDVDVLTRTVSSAVLFMLLFLTGNTMMQSVRERIPEFAVMRTLGFSDAGTLALVFAEALLLCALAGACGLLAAKLGLSLVRGKLPIGMSSLVVFSWTGMAIGFAFALAVAFGSALIPAFRIRRMNIVDALAGR
ncbi:MAG TPA: ABC transporter permease [Rhizomicrobium sp.]|jgi:putative ABC transport system permease protein